MAKSTPQHSTIVQAAAQSDWFATGSSELRNFFSGACSSDQLLARAQQLAAELQASGMKERDAHSVALACSNLMASGELLRSVIDYFKTQPAQLSQTAAYRVLYVDGERLGGDALAVEVIGAHGHRVSMTGASTGTTTGSGAQSDFSASALLLVSEGVIRELAQLFVAFRTGETAVGAAGVDLRTIVGWEQQLSQLLAVNVTLREQLGQASEQVEELCRDLGIQEHRIQKAA